MRFSNKARLALAACLASVACAGAAFAQTSSDKTIRWIVPYAPGGGIDIVTRILAHEVQQQLGRTIIVENQAGANTILGANELARSKPDGTTVLSADIGTLAFNPSLYKDLRYDASTLVPAGGMVRIPMMLVTRNGFPAKSVAELLEYAKQNPGAISYASAGPGSPHHLAMKLFEQRAGVELLHVPYKGAAPATQDLLGGRIDIMMIGMAEGLTHVNSGRIQPLATATEQPLPQMPELPTLNDSGLPGVLAVSWVAAVLPPDTPPAISEDLGQAIQQALKNPDVQEKLAHRGVQPLPLSGSEMRDYAAAQRELWGNVILAGNITLE